MAAMEWTAVPSPIGRLGVAVDGAGVCLVRFAGPAGPGGDTPLLAQARTELDEYFAGTRTEFTLPLAAAGGTPFERAVWAEIAGIPYAEMLTYGQIAARVGEPDAARAVGVACNHNPLPIVVPCHRVVGAGGKLVGFGGGLPLKRFLLELEARVRIERTFTVQ
jgi:methylated-DNA-[protein]-cysteine S-methyltransferase